MRRIVATIILCTIFFTAPIYAQMPPQATPNATGAVRDLSEAAQALGTSNVVLIIIVIIGLGLVGLMIIVAARGLTPMIKTIGDLNEARSELQSQLMSRLEKGDATAAKTADINERTVGVLGTLMTKVQAEDSVKAIQTTVTEARDKTISEIQSVGKTLDTAILILEKEQTNRSKRDDLDATQDVTLALIAAELKAVKETLIRLASENNVTELTGSVDIKMGSNE